MPNSSVPVSVVPPGVSKESTILNNRIVRVGSTTSSELDKNILYRMKEFELVGQQLFGIQPSQRTPSSLMMARKGDPHMVTSPENIFQQ